MTAIRTSLARAPSGDPRTSEERQEDAGMDYWHDKASVAFPKHVIKILPPDLRANVLAAAEWAYGPRGNRNAARIFGLRRG